MSLLQSSKISYVELSKRDSPLGGRRPTATTTTNTTRRDPTEDNDSDYLEDMMTDSAIAGTPPLDLGFDSGDDYDDDDGNSDLPSMRSPVSPLSFQPVPILDRKRKDSRGHVSPVHLLDCNVTSQQEEFGGGHLPAPALDNSFNSKGGSTKGRRSAVTFCLDEPVTSPPSSSPPAKLNMIQRPTFNCVRFRHDEDGDVMAVTVATTADAVSNDSNGQDITRTKESRQNDSAVHNVERALRRVSISLVEDEDDDDDEDEDEDKDNGRDQDDNQDTDHNTVAQSASQNASPNPNKSTTTNTDTQPPQEIILNHILSEAAPQDMLVALFDRPSELEALAARHSEFFNVMYSSLLSKANCNEFKKMLFQPREVLSDREWMKSISEQLESLPYILEKFKNIVGWIGPASLNDSDDSDSYYGDDTLWGEDEYGYRDSSFENVQIKWFRDIQEEFPLETFQECYPQFFINARECLEGKRMSYGGDQRDQYVIFCETLDLTREDLRCDSAWVRRMNGCLEKHPELMLQLKEIIAYEVDYDA
ncbi:hypothetical protein BGX21_002919 [Mortierella sp. AD011]|nr:hypothetical protein BGX20_005303 [Mortierella sp. AD010]KAF9378342.1 hypothetical protein BGX21_002919 [Mortierella sp. AD011]